MSKSLDALEALVRFAQHYLTENIPNTEDKTIAIACAALFRDWIPGQYKVGDIRLNAAGRPRECMTDHDSMINTDWTIDERTLWKPYHSRSKEYALPFETPTGAHDMYLAGEYMIWTDGNTYKCINDTAYSPGDYPDAWEVV